MFKGAWGYRNDGDAGLSHVGARFYDAQVGRFITRDTYLDQHPYLYCDHDPIDRADPSAHESVLELWDGSIVDSHDRIHREPPFIKGPIERIGDVIIGAGIASVISGVRYPGPTSPGRIKIGAGAVVVGTFIKIIGRIVD